MPTTDGRSTYKDAKARREQFGEVPAIARYEDAQFEKAMRVQVGDVVRAAYNPCGPHGQERVTEVFDNERFWSGRGIRLACGQVVDASLTLD